MRVLACACLAAAAAAGAAYSDPPAPQHVGAGPSALCGGLGAERWALFDAFEEQYRATAAEAAAAAAAARPAKSSRAPPAGRRPPPGATRVALKGELEGWYHEARTTNTGRNYSVFLSPDGRQFFSRVACLRSLGRA